MLAACGFRQALADLIEARAQHSSQRTEIERLQLQIRHVEDAFWDEGGATVSALRALPLLGACRFTLDEARAACAFGHPVAYALTQPEGDVFHADVENAYLKAWLPDAPRTYICLERSLRSCALSLHPCQLVLAHKSLWAGTAKPARKSSSHLV